MMAARAAPRVWLHHGFLSDATVDEILLAADVARCWERVSETQDTCMLESSVARPLAHSDIMRNVDERVASALGTVVANVEPGSIQRYRAGYQTHNAHLDQGHEMKPARVASAIIYLDDLPMGAGHTVFALASFGQPAPDGDVVSRWNRVLRSGLVQDRFFWPLCNGDDRGKRAIAGDALYQLALQACVAGRGIRPRRGTALFFENLVDGEETIEAVHASCGLALPDTPTKRTLVKLACDGRVR
jgi:hypothetical protein